MSVAGFGFRAAASVASLRDALARAGGPLGVTLLAAPADRIDAPELRTLAVELSLPLRPVAPAQIMAARTLTQSKAALQARGTGSLAEATALAAAGGGAALTGPRAISGDRLAACAIAEGLEP